MKLSRILTLWNDLEWSGTFDGQPIEVEHIRAADGLPMGVGIEFAVAHPLPLAGGAAGDTAAPLPATDLHTFTVNTNGVMLFDLAPANSLSHDFDTHLDNVQLEYAFHVGPTTAGRVHRLVVRGAVPWRLLLQAGVGTLLGSVFRRVLRR